MLQINYDSVWTSVIWVLGCLGLKGFCGTGFATVFGVTVGVSDDTALSGNLLLPLHPPYLRQHLLHKWIHSHICQFLHHLSSNSIRISRVIIVQFQHGISQLSFLLGSHVRRRVYFWIGLHHWLRLLVDYLVVVHLLLLEIWLFADHF